MSNYAQTLSKHRRLTILRFLAQSAEYTSNASILLDVCNGYGVTSTRDQVTGDLNWLSDQGMVSLNTNGDFIVATLSAHGLDVAEGRARHEGVQRARPKV